MADARSAGLHSGASPPDLMAELIAMRKELTRMAMILDGSPDADVRGIRERMRKVEELVDTMADERQRMAWMLRGVMIGLGFTGVASFAGLITQILTVFGGK